MSQEPSEAEQLVVTHVVPATPDVIFAVLADPSRHHDTEPGDWVRDAIDAAPITAVGQVFGMNMHLDMLGGDYVMHNEVTEFEPDRVIAWMPGTTTDEGRLQTGGWTWHYRLEPTDGGTAVTLTYDWSRTPPQTRAGLPALPPFGRGFLHRSLDALERAVTEKG